MKLIKEVRVASLGIARIESVVGRDRFAELMRGLERAKAVVGRRTIWNINSTALGGGVAEMLQPMLAYARGLGVDVRWGVISGDPRFFEITKRVHNNLHASEGDGGELGPAEHAHYEATLAGNARELIDLIEPGDIVLCHDPQTAGLVPALRRGTEALVIWRCHVGHDRPNQLVKRGWAFLIPYLTDVHATVFSRKAYLPPEIDHGKSVIIPPSIDPLSAKNQPMDPATVKAILVYTGIIEGPMNEAEPVFLREDGSVSRVVRCADVFHLGRAPTMKRPLVVQVSRWDYLKDPIGVMESYVRYMARERVSLVLAGPNVSAVADDPEGGRVLDEVEAAWRKLDHEIRKHVHIACLPMEDREENAAIVNALQRHATVVVQKSLYEGFGLTVTEAMWKARPVVATAVGGIPDQIDDGVHGLLVEDPNDLESFGKAVVRLLKDRGLADRLAQNARRRVEQEFLFTRHLFQYADLFERLLK